MFVQNFKLFRFSIQTNFFGWQFFILSAEFAKNALL